MSAKSKTWWGQQFLRAIEAITDAGRLSRGRSYAGDRRIKSFTIDASNVKARVRGNVNPYFGVYKEPTYTTRVALRPLSARDWQRVIHGIGSKAGLVAKLLMNEMPDNIGDGFSAAGRSLLPASGREFVTDCSCPDFANPCKHVAGVCYRLASHLDRDPFLLFELRGMARETLVAELGKTPLGQVLAASLQEKKVQPGTSESFFTRVESRPAPKTVSVKAFWQGSKPLPAQVDPVTASRISAIWEKKGGDHPAFWPKDDSFLRIVEEIHDRVRWKNKLTTTPLSTTKKTAKRG